MPPPPLTATSSLYNSALRYTGNPWVTEWTAAPCDRRRLEACLDQLDQCFVPCGIARACSSPEVAQRRAVSSTCLSCVSSNGCSSPRRILSRCQELYGCPSGSTCYPDFARPQLDFCCSGGMGPCRGNCVPPLCPSPQQERNPNTCLCECPNTCPPEQIQNPLTCVCGCLERCLPGQIQDPASCACFCPTGTTLCAGRCVPECGPGRVLSRSCGCECIPTSCPPPTVQNRSTCACVCPPCGPGYTQDLQTCVCTCETGLTDCGGTCKNLTNDYFNCGSCGTVCGPYEVCCGGRCEALTSDTHCGGCNRACGPGESCVTAALSAEAGRCCPTGQVWCLGQGYSRCSNLQTQTDCGSCGVACPSTQRCVNGRCQCLTGTTCGDDCCTTGETCCNGKCVNLQTDSANCGVCGDECNTNVAHCQSGDCQCDAGYFDCGSGPVRFCCRTGEAQCVAAPWLPEGAGCCPVGDSVACPPSPGNPSGGCAPTGAVCCSSGGYCPSGYYCCAGRCCRF